MLIIFKSSADGDVIMLGDVGRRILAILGKDPDDAKGIVTVAQIPAAIAALRAAAAQEAPPPPPEEAGHAPDERPEEIISLARRAAPLLQMLARAERDGVPVTWTR
ncbi:MAG: DUF1840 domain-containing protein [Candidatus Dactylopiibacterium sp.]|nr:DUF1840 domain-containing protein [Candidatus Dactylopiibacterium sp.]